MRAAWVICSGLHSGAIFRMVFGTPYKMPEASLGPPLTEQAINLGKQPHSHPPPPPVKMRKKKSFLYVSQRAPRRSCFTLFYTPAITLFWTAFYLTLPFHPDPRQVVLRMASNPPSNDFRDHYGYTRRPSISTFDFFIFSPPSRMYWTC